MGIVYVHLIACCVAVGLILMSDIAMVKQLLKADHSRGEEGPSLSDLHRTVSAALAILWITGITLVSTDAWKSGLGYFANPKIQAKITIVFLLTLNGVLLHRAVMPALERAGALVKPALSERMLAIFAGSVSAVSWAYAAMLGIGRPLSWKYSLAQIMGMYPVLIGAGIATMLGLTAWSRYRASTQPA
jgi:hypothetical protein